MRNLAVRLSDTERTSAESRLRDACAEGRITPEELADRLDVVYAARTAADLAPLLRDLPRRREWFAVRRRYAAWWQRAAAAVVDGATVVALSAAAAAVPAVALHQGYFLWWGLLAPAVTLAYFTLCHGSRRGQTVGDYALEIAVRTEAGGRLRYGQALGRTVATLAFLTFWFAGGVLDFLWPLWDRRCQAWHDKIAGTVVVRKARG